MEYHVAISFAGEDRGIAEQIVTLLHSNGVKVFYDYDYQDEIWGKDTYVYLSDIYENQSLFFLPLISSNYAKKMWPRHEIRSAFARAFRASEEYILPVRLDDTQIQGIPLTIGYLDFRTVSLNEIIDNILKKLSKKGVILHKDATTSLQTDFKKNPISNSPKDLVQFLGQLLVLESYRNGKGMDIPIGLKNNIIRGRESEFIHHSVKVKLSLKVSNVDTWRLIIS